MSGNLPDTSKMDRRNPVSAVTISEYPSERRDLTRELMEAAVPIWIALSSTVILYNSLSLRKQLRVGFDIVVCRIPLLQP